MDSKNSLSEWFRAVGYDGEMPESLISICNNSTLFIWENLMQNVKPKQEVQRIRKNIIVNRLQKKTLDKQDDFLFKMEEVEVFKKKQLYTKELKPLKEAIEEKNFKIQKMSKNCDIQGITLNELRKQIKENEEKTYLLDLKGKSLDAQLRQSEKALSTLINVTPIEREENTDTKIITERLEKCVEKLQKIIKDNFKPDQRKPQGSFIHTVTSSMKTPQNVSSIESYLDKQEKNFNQIHNSCVKRTKSGIKENVAFNHQKAVCKPLFQIPQVLVEDVEVQTFQVTEIIQVSQQKITDTSIMTKKRESLGILPPHYLSEMDDDEFLQISHSESKVTDNTFKTPSQIIKPFHNTFKSESSFKSSTISTRNSKSNLLTRKDLLLYNDSFVNESLEKLLHENNRQVLYEVLQRSVEETSTEFLKSFAINKTMENRQMKINEEDISKVLAVHVLTESKIMKQKRQIRELMHKIRRAKQHALEEIRTKNIVEAQEWLNSHIKQIGLDSALEAMKREIGGAKSFEESKELANITLRIAKIKDEIVSKMDQISCLTEEICRTHKLIETTGQEVLGPVWNLRLYKSDLSCLKPLSQDLWTTEIETFRNFPLEYSRICNYTDSNTYYKDICTDAYPWDMNLNKETIRMISEIVGSSFGIPECLFLNFIKQQIKWQILKSLNSNNVEDSRKWPKYTFEELQNQDSYVKPAVEKLHSIMFSRNAKKTLATADHVRKTMDISFNMALKDYISPEKLVDGHNYLFYENKLKMMFRI